MNRNYIPSPEPVDPETLAFLSSLSAPVVDHLVMLVHEINDLSQQQKDAVHLRLVAAAGDLKARNDSPSDHSNRLLNQVINLIRTLDREANPPPGME